MDLNLTLILAEGTAVVAEGSKYGFPGSMFTIAHPLFTFAYRSSPKIAHKAALLTFPNKNRFRSS